MTSNNKERGFTLIELSIVLVIIGLIVGGVLVGQDLIKAAAVRAQISQIDKYNTAVNTFLGKYGALPGDLTQSVAAQFGFANRGPNPGEGDGNGVIEGYAANVCGFCENNGETAMFWADLGKASLIEGNFAAANSVAYPTSDIVGSGFDLYYPAAKIGGGNYVYVWSGGPNVAWNGANEINNDWLNYFGLSAITKLPANDWELLSSPGLTVMQAYSIDKKVDDGLPQSGAVFAMYLNGQRTATLGPEWAGTNLVTGPAYNTATSGGPTTCFDNGGVAGPQRYSVEQTGGAGVNCALSFGFQ